MERAIIIRLCISIVVGGLLGGVMGYYGKCTSGTCPLTATPWRGAIYGAMMGALITLSFRN